jgi:hypothetical protein
MKQADGMSENSFAVSRVQHRAFGALIRIRLAADFVLRLTPAEASSLAFALVAVRDGVSPEREIYISPIASDHAFVGSVTAAGMSIAVAAGEMELSWSHVGKLAEALAVAIG